ncbi:MAG: NAD(P)/FAD-dependent oxidoreductase [Flavobacteriales bacterium]|nr:NAD(P)/FAD-dependent oxidoreductase [Flavobacteriales bacterium]
MSDRTFDIVVIGAGLAGLECAYILAAEGYGVCVLEKNNQLGGSLQVFSRDKRVFDTGVHYVGGLDPGQNLHSYFRYFGIMDQLKLHRLDPDGFDRISFRGDPREYPLAQGRDNFVRQLLPFFPREEAALRAYVAAMRDVCERFPWYYINDFAHDERGDPELWVNARERIASFTSNEKLRNVLAGNNGLYAGNAATTPFFVHALVANSFIESAYRCVDGGSQIAKHLAHNARAKGATILARKEVTGFDMGPGGIQRVRTQDGDAFTTKRVIADIHPASLLRMLGPGTVRKAYRDRITGLENSVGSFSVHLTLEPGAIPYRDHNLYHFAVSDVWQAVDYGEADWPTSLMVFTPISASEPTRVDSLAVMTYMRYAEVARWADTHNTVAGPEDRGEDYAAFKRSKEERVLDLLEERIPGVRAATKAMYSSTPLSFRDYIGSPDGSMYGVVKAAQSPMRSYIPPVTRVPNLLLTGQNTNLHGLLGVTVSAMVTCAELLGKPYLVRRVRDAAGI